MSLSKPGSRLLWSATLFLVVIGIAAVTRRSLVLSGPARDLAVAARNRQLPWLRAWRGTPL